MGNVDVGVTLLSFIWALALTRLLECWRDLWVARQRVRTSASQLLWMAAILLISVLSWLPLGVLGDRLQGWVFVTMLAYAIGIYFAAAMVSPKVPDAGPLDLAEYETREGGAYKATVVVLMLLSLPLNQVLATGDGPPPAFWAFAASQWFVVLVAGAALVSLRPGAQSRTICAAVVLGLAAFVLARNLSLV